jgi:hypothetical protein
VKGRLFGDFDWQGFSGRLGLSVSIEDRFGLSGIESVLLSDRVIKISWRRGGT